MLWMFGQYPSYKLFKGAEFDCFRGNGTEKSWLAVLRELHTWRKTIAVWLPVINTDYTTNLANSVDHPIRSEKSNKIPAHVVMSRCCIGWQGILTQANLYAMPRIVQAITAIVLPFRGYVETVTRTENESLDYANVFEWACLKRFQEMFSKSARPCDVMPAFFGEDTEFGKFEMLHLPDTSLVLPKITRQSAQDTKVDLSSLTANPSQWHSLIASLNKLFQVDELTSGLCGKPLPKSSSPDAIFMSRLKNTEQHIQTTLTTLTVGLAVKNYKSATFGWKDLIEECTKFKLLFIGLDKYTLKSFGAMKNVLIVCATKYTMELAGLFGTLKYATLDLSTMEFVDRHVYAQWKSVVLWSGGRASTGECN